MRCFEDGLRDEFFRLYERYMPQQFRESDLAAQKIEFWLNVYFAVFPALPSSAGKKGAEHAEGISAAHAPGATLAVGLAKLRVFIETRGRDVARTEEFLPFYALPYVPQPQRHPTFKALFEPRWTLELRATVEAFLADAPDEMPPPRILTVLRYYYGLDDTATSASGMVKVADERDAALVDFDPRGGGEESPSRAGAAAADAYGHDHGGHGGARRARVAIGEGATAGGARGDTDARYRVISPRLTRGGYVPPGGGGRYSMLPRPGSGVRGVTPLLEGIASLHDYVPTPDLTNVHDEHHELDSLAAQIAALESTAPKSPTKPPKSSSTTAAAAVGVVPVKATADVTAVAHSHRSVPPVNLAAMSRVAAASPADAASKHSGGGVGGFGQHGENHTFEDLLFSRIEGPPVIAAPTVHYVSGGGLETHRGGPNPVSERENVRVRRVMTPYRDVVFSPLDYNKIRLDLRADSAAAGGKGANQGMVKEAEGRAGRLLQSLRWRITRSAPGHPRQDATQTLADGDVLALRVAHADGAGRLPSSLVDSLVGCGGRVRGEVNPEP
jgi:hypothetical protein